MMNEPASHMLGVDEAARRLGVDPRTGLQPQDVMTRARLHGPNRLAEKPPRPLWILFFD